MIETASSSFGGVMKIINFAKCQTIFDTQHFLQSAALLSLTVQHNIKSLKIMKMVVCRSVHKLLFISSKLKTNDNIRRDKEKNG